MYADALASETRIRGHARRAEEREHVVSGKTRATVSPSPKKGLPLRSEIDSEHILSEVVQLPRETQATLKSSPLTLLCPKQASSGQEAAAATEPTPRRSRDGRDGEVWRIERERYSVYSI